MSLSCTFERAVVAALRDADNGSCHFHCMILADFCVAGVRLFLLLDCCLFSDLCKTRVGRRYDKTNVEWEGGRYSELLTLENHVDRTK